MHPSDDETTSRGNIKSHMITRGTKTHARWRPITVLLLILSSSSYSNEVPPQDNTNNNEVAGFGPLTCTDIHPISKKRECTFTVSEPVLGNNALHEDETTGYCYEGTHGFIEINMILKSTDNKDGTICSTPKERLIIEEEADSFIDKPLPVDDEDSKDVLIRIGKVNYLKSIDYGVDLTLYLGSLKSHRFLHKHRKDYSTLRDEAVLLVGLGFSHRHKAHDDLNEYELAWNAFKEGVKLYRQVLNMMVQSSSTNTLVEDEVHLILADAIWHMGDACIGKKGDDDDCIKIFTEAENIYKTVLGPHDSHLHLADLFVQISAAYTHRATAGDYLDTTKGDSLFEENLFPNIHQPNIKDQEASDSDLRMAMTKMEEAIEIYSSEKGGGHIDRLLADAWQRLGVVKLHQQDHQGTIKAWNESVRLCKKLSGSDLGPDIANLLIELSSVHMRLMQYDESIESYREAVTIYKTIESNVGFTGIPNARRSTLQSHSSDKMNYPPQDMASDETLNTYKNTLRTYNYQNQHEEYSPALNAHRGYLHYMIANIHYNRMEHTDAFYHILRAIDIYKSEDIEIMSLADAYLFESFLHMVVGDFDASYNVYVKAIEILKKFPENPLHYAKKFSTDDGGVNPKLPGTMNIREYQEYSFNVTNGMKTE